MRTHSLITAVAAAAALAGCVTYPAYQPVPVARLTPEQSAALAARPLSQEDRDRYAKASADAQSQDQAAFATVVPYTYAYPAPYSYGYYGYPYYGGFYPWFPGVSLSFGYGFRGGYGGYRGYHGYGGRGHR